MLSLYILRTMSKDQCLLPWFLLCLFRLQCQTSVMSLFPLLDFVINKQQERDFNLYIVKSKIEQNLERLTPCHIWFQQLMIRLIYGLCYCSKACHFQNVCKSNGWTYFDPINPLEKHFIIDLKPLSDFLINQEFSLKLCEQYFMSKVLVRLCPTLFAKDFQQFRNFTNCLQWLLAFRRHIFNILVVLLEHYLFQIVDQLQKYRPLWVQ